MPAATMTHDPTFERIAYREAQRRSNRNQAVGFDTDGIALQFSDQVAQAENYRAEAFSEHRWMGQRHLGPPVASRIHAEVVQFLRSRGAA